MHTLLEAQYGDREGRERDAVTAGKTTLARKAKSRKHLLAFGKT